MVKYRDQKDGFEIEDYQAAKRFASFLPSVAGMDGKPIWSFYTNYAQGITSFGVEGKNHPMVPFESAVTAYQSVKLKGFRTFIKTKAGLVQPFFDTEATKQTMTVRQADFSLHEERNGFSTDITYATVPHRSYGALIRKVTLRNLTLLPMDLEVLDGLPIFLSYGISYHGYMDMATLMASYCRVEGVEKATPYFKYSATPSDSAEVKGATAGNWAYAFDETGKRLSPIVDRTLIFGGDESWISPQAFLHKPWEELQKEPQQIENQLPCVFFGFQKTLKPQESYTFYVYFGMSESLEEYQNAYAELCPERAEEDIQANRDCIKQLCSPASSHTAYPRFDAAYSQAYLDNNLRGGFPTLLNPKGEHPQVYYVFGRKHGDMERDYNEFDIPYHYLSGGPGNFRDVNQNRRNDLFFAPFVKDYNIHQFFDLIQVDGQNPLLVNPPRCHFEVLPPEAASLPETKKAELLAFGKDFVPGALLTLLLDDWKLKKEEAVTLFNALLSQSTQTVSAAFGDGYWVDHWTYNVDLLESFSSIYPEEEETLFFTKNYRYFYSPVMVEPRKEKYCLLPNGKIRQYGAINLEKTKQICESRSFDLGKTAWLQDEKGQVIKTDLASKMFALIAMKFSALDNRQEGIEMESDKPGWNDATNGLPGLFASGVSESVELLRLIRYTEKHLAPFGDHTVSFLPEQEKLWNTIATNLPLWEEEKLSSFELWDRMTSAREALRAAYFDHAEGRFVTHSVKELLPLLKAMDRTLQKGLRQAKEENGGILPSYLAYEVDSYEKTGHVNFLGYPTVKALSFRPIHLPQFLEADARALKLADGTLEEKDVQAIAASDLHDAKLGLYKTCESLDNASYEIGRIRAFSKGWLERESCFLHMDYKYLLGLLEAGYYHDFYREIRSNWTLNMDPNRYGRWPIEASSFVIPSNNPNPAKHGLGCYARLTGANAEFLNMAVLLFAGDAIYSYENRTLHFHLKPLLSKDFFDANGDCDFLLFNRCRVFYHNPKHLDCFEGVHLTYVIGNERYEGEVVGALAQAIRDGKIARLDVFIDR